jgi:hypothetical protein
VFAFGVVELKGAGHTVQDAVGGAGQISALQPDVVID